MSFTSVLFNTFHYDLIEDSSYSEIYNKKRGVWLEKKTADCFKRIFPSEKVLLNPQYPNGEEYSDVLVLHDRKIYIVQCKSKRLRYESEIWNNYEILKDDIGKIIELLIDGLGYLFFDIDEKPDYITMEVDFKNNITEINENNNNQTINVEFGIQISGMIYKKVKEKQHDFSILMMYERFSKINYHFLQMIKTAIIS